MGGRPGSALPVPARLSEAEEGAWGRGGRAPLFPAGFREGAEPEPEGAVLGGSLGGGSPAPLPPFVWARLRWPLRCRLATAAPRADWLGSRRQQPMAWLLPWEVRPAALIGAPPAGTPPAGAGLPGGGRDARVPGGGWPRGAGLGRRARVNPPLPRPPAVPLPPRVPRSDPRPLLSPPPPGGGGGGGGCCCHPPGPPVPLALTAAGLAGPAGPGTGGHLLIAAATAMLAVRPPHWGPHRSPAPRGPGASPDPGRGGSWEGRGRRGGLSLQPPVKGTWSGGRRSVGSKGSI